MASPSVGQQLKESFKDVTFEDQIAQLVMAMTYSTRHIEVAIFEARKKAQLTAREEQELAGIADEEERNKTRDSFLGKTQAKLDKPVLRNVDARVAAWKKEFEEGLKTSPKLTKEELQKAGTGKQFFVVGQEQPQGLQFVDADISEIDMDTAAAIIHSKVLYVAFNFKVRTQDKVKLNYEPKYAHFGSVAWSGAIERVQAALESDLSTRDYGASGRMLEPDIQKVVYVGLNVDPTTAQTNAAPHAEMQLLSHLFEQALSPTGLRLGCSKACCANCAKYLRLCGVLYTSKHDNAVKHWTDPGKIETTAVKTFPVKWYSGQTQ